MGDTSDYANVVREFYRAVSDKDADAIAKLVGERFAEGVTLVLPPSLPYGGTFTGARKFGRMFAGMMSAPDPVGAVAIVVTDVVDGGDRVAAQLEFDWYAPGSRTSIRTGALELWSFNDGLVTEIRAYYWDTAACAAQAAAAASSD